MALDWVPIMDYGDVITTLSGNTTEHSLMNVASWSTTIETVGDIEGEDVGYRIKRIVGFYTLYGLAQPTAGNVFLRLWPGFQDQQNSLPVLPGPIVGANEARIANERFWWDAIRHGPSLETTSWWETNPVHHPHWSFLDLRPNVYIDKHTVPVLSIQNATDQRVDFGHRWRMLVEHK